MTVFNSITKGLDEAIKHEKGIIKAKRVKLTVAPVPTFNATEIKTLRNDMEMTQVIFAAVMGVSTKTVEAWESGKNKPDGAAKRMLSILKIDPDFPSKYKIVSIPKTV